VSDFATECAEDIERGDVILLPPARPGVAGVAETVLLVEASPRPFHTLIHTESDTLELPDTAAVAVRCAA
jgi:hypothetical protein